MAQNEVQRFPLVVAVDLSFVHFNHFKNPRIIVLDEAADPLILKRKN
jgi:hypothetical protein